MRKFFSTLAAACLGIGVFAQLNTSGPVAALVAERQEQQATFIEATPFTAAAKSAERDVLVDGAVDHATVLKADASALAGLLATRPSDLDLRFPTVNGDVELLLVQADIFADGFNVITASTGNAFDYAQGLHYRGIVKGQPSSLVAISIFKDEVMGFVNDADGDHTLGKLEGSADEHVYYANKDFKGTLDIACSTPDDGVGYTDDQLKAHGSAKTVKCVNLYWEVNYDVFQNKGSVTNTANYVTGIFNQSSTIYNNDGISVLLSQVYVWDVASPYTATSTSSLLGQFQSYRNSFNGNLGNLLGYAGGGGIAAGFAGLCNSNLDNSQCYSGIQSTYSTVPTYSWTVMVVTHEQGHLLGSRHTHACVWNGNNTVIDGCGQQAGYSEGTCATGAIPSTGGTIMSYCHLNAVGINFNNGFGTQPKNVIVNGINAAACLSNCSTGGCGTPGSLTASSVTTTSAALGWGAVSGATSYTLQWKLASSGTWTTTVSGLTTTSYALTGLVANTAYNFQVLAVCASGSSAYSATGSFTTLSGTGCPDALEANNTAATAAAITLPASINALIASASDVDYYKFTTTSTSNISIGLSNLAGDYDLQLLNSAGTQVAISQAGGTTSEAITYNSAVAGTYTIYVYGYGGAFSATQCYLLTASAAAVGCTDAYEPNNTSGTAYNISANSARTALISSSTDIDWFRFSNTSSQRNIKATLTNLPADYDLRLYRNSTLLATSQNAGTTAETIIYNTTTVSTSYRVQVFGYGGAFNAGSCYTLTVLIGASSFLPGGSLENGTLDDGAWKDDGGLVVFPNPANEQLNIVIPAGGEVRTIDLLDAMGKAVWSTQQRNADGEIRLVMDVRELPAGIYLVRATEGDNVVTKRVMIGR